MVCCVISQLEGTNQVVSDQGVRKGLYQKIVASFPEGWITSGQVSREGTLSSSRPRHVALLTAFPVSVMKKKYEKELEND